VFVWHTSWVQDIESIDKPITDAELTALAMAADPDAPIANDAVPFGTTDETSMSLLPQWYMPAPARRIDRRRRIVFAGLVCSLLFANIAGFCVTNGFPEFVW
jgi:hypothetical protein